MIPTSSDQLTIKVDRFFDAVEAHGNAIRSGNSKAANRAFDKAEQARTLLGDSTGAPGVLETLLAHPSPLVRMWTAADVLKWNPDKAIPVLGQLLIEPFDQEPSPSVRIEVRLTSRGLLYRHFGVSDFDRDKLIEPLRAYGIELPRQRG